MYFKAHFPTRWHSSPRYASMDLPAKPIKLKLHESLSSDSTLRRNQYFLLFSLYRFYTRPLGRRKWFWKTGITLLNYIIIPSVHCEGHMALTWRSRKQSPIRIDGTTLSMSEQKGKQSRRFIHVIQDTYFLFGSKPHWPFIACDAVCIVLERSAPCY